MAGNWVPKLQNLRVIAIVVVAQTSIHLLRTGSYEKSAEKLKWV